MLCQIVLGPQFQNVYFELLLFNLAHGFRKFGCKPKISKIIKEKIVTLTIINVFKELKVKRN